MAIVNHFGVKKRQDRTSLTNHYV